MKRLLNLLVAGVKNLPCDEEGLVCPDCGQDIYHCDCDEEIEV